LRRTGQHFIHFFIAQLEAGFTNRTDVAATRVFNSIYKLQAITLSPNSNKPNIEPVDIPLLRQQVSYTNFDLLQHFETNKMTCYNYFLDTRC